MRKRPPRRRSNWSRRMRFRLERRANPSRLMVVVTPMVLAGLIGGAVWASVPAFLRTRLSVNEILSSLMLTYVALQVLGYLVSGPWKDPNGRNFPATAPL